MKNFIYLCTSNANDGLKCAIRHKILVENKKS